MAHDPGSIAWQEYLRIREAAKPARLGELPVTAKLAAGDAGTFACHVHEKVKKGAWSIWRIKAKRANAVLAVHEGSTPVSWAPAGGIVVDTASGGFFPDGAAKELANLEDEDFADDVVAEAIFDDANKLAGAVVKTPAGIPFAAFRLEGDGEYAVAKGVDAKGGTCALIVIQSEK